MRLIGPCGAVLFVISMVSGQTTSYLPTKMGTRWLYQFRFEIETVAGPSIDTVYFQNDFRETVDIDTVSSIPYQKIYSRTANMINSTFPTYAWYAEDDSGLYEVAYCFDCSTAAMDKVIERTGHPVEFGGYRFRSTEDLLRSLVSGAVTQADTIPWLDTPRVELRYPLETGTSWIWFNDPWHAVKTVFGDEWIETPSGQYEAKHLQVEYDLADSIDFHEWWAEGVGLIRREISIYAMRSTNEAGDSIGVHNGYASWELMADYFPARPMAGYFPLHAGDWWQYFVEDWSVNIDTSRYYETLRVTGAVSFSNGRAYKMLHNERTDYSRLFRFDSATAMVMEYGYGCNNAGEWPLYYFGLEPDSSWEGMPYDLCRGQWYGILGFDNRSIQHLGIDSTQLVYRIYTGIFTNINLRFAWNIGLVLEKISPEGSDSRRTLVAASVAGIEYGQYVHVERFPSLPARFELYGAFPNPFNPTTTIRYTLPATQQATLKVYDLLGREVATLVDGLQPAGEYQLPFDAGNLSSGIYLTRLVAGEYSKTIKILLLK